MDLEVVRLLIGLLSAWSVAGNSGDQGSGQTDVSMLDPDSLLLMPSTSTYSSVVKPTTLFASLTLSTMTASLTSISFLPAPSLPTPSPSPFSHITSPSPFSHITSSYFPLLTPSPTLSSSSSLQFPLSALLLTVSSSSSSSSLFTPQSTITPSLTDRIVPTSSPPPPDIIPTAVVLPGVIVGVVVVVVVLPLLAVVVCVVIGWRRKKSSGSHTLHSAHKDYIITADDKNKQEQSDLLSTSTELPHDKIFNFGISTDTFGISSSKDKGLDVPDALGGVGRGDLPALIFINAVDPTIPISSNTLPHRRKAKVNSGVDLRRHFDGLSSSKDSLRKGFKSTGSINKVGDGSTEKLLASDHHGLQLQELSKQKANIINLHSPSNDYSKTTSLLITNEGIEPTTDSYGYLFMEPLGSSATSTFKEQPEAKDHDVTKEEVLKTPLAETSLNNILSRIEVEVSKTDTSHYDVPKRLLKDRAKLVADDDSNSSDTPKQTANMLPKGDAKAESTDVGERGTSQPIVVNQTCIDPQHDTKSALGDMYKTPTTPNTSSTELDGRPTPTSVGKPEGIYDVPRSLLIHHVESNPVEAKIKDVTGRSKPKITPRAPTTKITSNTKKKEGVYDPPKSILLHSSEPTLKPGNVDSVGETTDASTSKSQKSSSEVTPEAVTSLAGKPQLKPKPKEIYPSKGTENSEKPPVMKVKPTPPPRRTATQKGSSKPLESNKA